MYRYLKDDLGVEAAVVGTQVGCSSPVLMAGLDAVDTHAYWQHPQFPAKPWDSANWFVNNVSMVTEPGGVLTRLAMARVAGKPHLVTEYNHSAPNTYSAEAPLLLAAFAALQDFDGVFLFSYSHRNDDWDADTFANFFDIDRHTTKMANLPIAAAMFLRADVSPAAKQVTAALAPRDESELIRRHGRPWNVLNGEALGASPETALIHRVAIDLSGGPSGAGTARPSDAELAQLKTFVSDTSQFIWHAGDRAGQAVIVNTPRTKAVVGFTDGGEFDLAGVTIRPGRSRQGWSTIALTLTEGEEFAGPGRALLVATGTVENTDMGWKNAAKSTVGRDWGHGPTRVEGIDATITLPAKAADVTVWALDERGQRNGEVKVEDTAGHASFRIAPEHQTIWYEIAIR